jgi:hypothetical protein
MKGKEDEVIYCKFNGFHGECCRTIIIFQCGITVILFRPMRFKYDSGKSKKLKADPRRKIGFSEIQEFGHIPIMWTVVTTTQSSFVPSDGRRESFTR